MRLEPVPNRDGLARAVVTMAEALSAAGYATDIFGKWHLDGTEGAPPDSQGFGTVRESRAGWKDSPHDPTNPRGICSLTRAAGEFMEQNRSRPFFVFLSHYAIHTALQARPGTLERFRAKAAGAQHSRPLYAACTFDMDDSVGLLLQRIASLNLQTNTLVVFTSDNGGTRQSSQEPLRGNKGCHYEAGIRVPFIVRWPGVVKPGTTCNVPVMNLDLYETFLAAAGVAAKTNSALDGRSLLPLLKDGTTISRPGLFWHFPGYLDTPVIRGRDPVFRTRPVTVIGMAIGSSTFTTRNGCLMAAGQDWLPITPSSFSTSAMMSESG